MVYCGKPSKGCKNCRERKIRCDTVVPTCGQCMKKGIACPGYRNQLDLAFRNESDSVIEKAKAKSSKLSLKVKEVPAAKWSPIRNSKGITNDLSDALARPISSDSSPQTPLVNYANPNNQSFYFSTLYFDDDDELSLPLSSWPIFSMYPTIEELGNNCFFENFVAQHNGPSHGHFNYLTDMVRHEQGMDHTLRASVLAAGLAKCANTFKSAELMGQARRQYVFALRNINAALRSPEDAIKDSTLVSILIVSIFETITGSNRISLKAWTEHISGASSLLQLRGRAQIHTSIGLRLFIHVTSHLLVSCFQREMPMPPQILQLRLEAFRLVPPNPAMQILKLVDELTVFRSAFRDGTYPDPATIISTALGYDAQLMQIASHLPLAWLYETVNTEDDPDIVWKGSYDIYFDYWVAQIWNGMRSARIMLHETIRYRLLEGFTSVPPRFLTNEFIAQFQASTSMLVKMNDDILRSIPQHIGYVTRKPFQHQCHGSSGLPMPPLNGTLFTGLLEIETPFPTHGSPQTPLGYRSIPLTSPRPTTSPKPFTPPQSTPAIGGYFLLHPLYTAAISRVSTPESRAFIIKRLRYIGDTMGIMQGNALANFVELSVNGLQVEGMKTLEKSGVLEENEGVRYVGNFRLARSLET